MEWGSDLGSRDRTRAEALGEHVLAERVEKLPEAQRPQRPEGDPADWKGEPSLLQAHLQEGPGRDHAEPRMVFPKEAQPLDRLRALLGLVEEEQGARREGRDVMARGQRLEEILRRAAGADQGEVLVALQVELEEQVEAAAQMADRRRFAGLAGPPEDERFAVVSRGPGGQDGIDLAREVQGEGLLKSRAEDKQGRIYPLVKYKYKGVYPATPRELPSRGLWLRPALTG